jgi:tripartite-type tricarboxylate transporter receptor subunit TctC
MKTAYALFALTMLVHAVPLIAAQPFPNRPIRIVTSPPGGGGDVSARLIAQGMGTTFNHPMVVDNRPAGVVGDEIVHHAPADGYTLLHSAVTTLALIRIVQKDAPFDPFRDFTPITLVGDSPNVLVVATNLPANSVAELIALAKAKPHQLNYGSAATGSPNHLAAELFKSMAGVDIVRVSYKGVGPALNDVAGGQVQVMFANASSIGPFLKAGKLRALAVTSAYPSALAPGLPTLASSGLPGYQSTSAYGVYAPTGTPAAIVAQLSGEMIQVLNSADIKDKLLASGIEVAAGTPDMLAAATKSEMTRMGPIVAATLERER